MGLKNILNGNWFIRIVMITWIICAVSVIALFKNMELIVHGQLYSYGLVFSPDWADPYRIYTWLIYVCLGLPMSLTGVALASSFLKVEKVPEKKGVVPQRQPQAAVNLEHQQATSEAPEKVENSKGGVNGSGISCPHCKKVFSRALVMLDCRSGKNQLVSVCPYCNLFLGNMGDIEGADEEFSAHPQRYQ
jgi:hypothetical protein